MALLLAVISIFLVSAQALEEPLSFLATMDQGSLQKQHEGLVADVKDWFVGTMKDMKNDVDSQVEHLKNVMDTSNKEGEKKIHQLYENSLLKLRKLNAPEVCLKNAELQLMAEKSNALQSFVTCGNLTLAGKDILLIVWEAGKLGTKLLLSADDVLNGLSNCWSWNPFKLVYCTVGWVKNVIADAYNSFSDIRDFTKNVSDLVIDIREQVNFCVHGGSDKMHSDFINALTDVHQCSIKQK